MDVSLANFICMLGSIKAHNFFILKAKQFLYARSNCVLAQARSPLSLSSCDLELNQWLPIFFYRHTWGKQHSHWLLCHILQKPVRLSIPSFWPTFTWETPLTTLATILAGPFVTFQELQGWQIFCLSPPAIATTVLVGNELTSGIDFINQRKNVVV